MPSNIRARFMGVKDCSLCTLSLTKVEQVWAKLFEGDYKMPKCPKCGEILWFKNLCVNIGIATYSSAPYGLKNTLGNREEIEIALECPDCSLTINGVGMGFKCSSNGDFTLEKIIVLRESTEMRSI